MSPAPGNLELLGPERGRAVVVRTVRRPALVLGSTQPVGVVDMEACARRGVAVVRRRSGGGAVLVAPADPLWLDVSLPRDDPLWSDDVSRAGWWVGEWFSAALGDLGLVTTVHHGPYLRGPHAELACFAGVGPGEVLAQGRKVVGVAQWRGRWGAVLHCAAYRLWDPWPLAQLLQASELQRSRWSAAWASAATGAGHPPERILERLVDHLPPGEQWSVTEEPAAWHEAVPG